MDMGFYARGLLLGFVISAPVGPVAMLVIRRVLRYGWLQGVLTGVGAATGDSFYSAVSAFGLSLVSGLLITYSRWLRFTGGIVLCWLAIRMFRAGPIREDKAVPGTVPPLGSSTVSALLITVTNPFAVVVFASAFTALGLSAIQTFGAAGALVAGVFTGAMLWWLSLSGLIVLLKGKLTPAVMRWINRVIGSILGACGVLAILSAI